MPGGLMIVFLPIEFPSAYEKVRASVTWPVTALAAAVILGVVLLTGAWWRVGRLRREGQG